jgi:hypothetical protein
MNLNTIKRSLTICHKELPSKATLLYARSKMKGGKCHFRSARKREFNEKLNDGN